MKNIIFILIILFAGLCFSQTQNHTPENINFKLDWATGNNENKDVYLNNPIDLELDLEGNSYILDYGDKNIKKYSPKGKLLKVIGKKGAGPGEFLSCWDLELHNNKIYVFDGKKKKIIIYDVNGEFIKSLPFLKSFNKFKVNEIGFYIEYIEMTRSQTGRNNKHILSRFTFDLNQEVKIDSIIIPYAKIIDSKRIVTIPFNYEYKWMLTKENKLITINSNDFLIKIFNKKLEHSKIVDGLKRLRVSEVEKEKYFEIVQSQSTRKRYKIDELPWPSYLPYFSDVVQLQNGNYLFKTYSLRKENTFYLLDANFNYKEEISLPNKIYNKYTRIFGNGIFVLEKNEESLPKLVRYVSNIK